MLLPVPISGIQPLLTTPCCPAGRSRASPPLPCSPLCPPQPSLHLQPGGFRWSRHLTTPRLCSAPSRGSMVLTAGTRPPRVWPTSSHTPPLSQSDPALRLCAVPHTHRARLFPEAFARKLPSAPPGTLFLHSRPLDALIPDLIHIFTSVLGGISLPAIPPHSPSPSPALCVTPGLLPLGQ